MPGSAPLSCPTSTHCLAVGDYIAGRQGPYYNVSLPVSATGGLGVVRRTSSAAYNVFTIACPSATDCVYGGGRSVNPRRGITAGIVVTSGYRSKTGASRGR